jgi:hypothetical protein
VQKIRLIEGHFAEAAPGDGNCLRRTFGMLLKN